MFPREGSDVALRHPVRNAPVWLVAMLLALAMGAVVVGLRGAGVLEPLELATYDRLLRWTRPAEGPDARVVLVRITERDVQRHGHPLTDALLSRALDTLVRAGPRAIGVDLYRDRPLPPGEAELEQLVRAHPEIVLTEKVGGLDDTPVHAPAYAAETGQVGFSDVHLDRDGRVRRALLLMHSQGTGRLSFGLQVALRYLAPEGVAPRWLERTEEGAAVPTLALGEAELTRFGPGDGGYVRQDAAGYQVLLAHPRGYQRFPSFTLDQVLAGAFPAEVVRDRAVLVGTMASSVHDLVPTPFGETFGIEHHAQVVSELFDRALGGAPGVRTLTGAQENTAVVAWSLVGALLATRVRSPRVLPFAVLVTVAVLVGGAAASFAAGWWLPFAPAAVALGLSVAAVETWRSLVEERNRRRVMDLFGRFLARDVAAELWHQRDEFLDGGRPRAQAGTITVLMSDLAGYTAVSESFDAEHLMAWINECLEALARTVGAHGGVVDDFAGDGVKANFGVPVPHKTQEEIDADARAAVASALAFEPEIEQLNRRFAERGDPPTRVRVGIHTGPAVFGVIGSSDRMKFTSVGDTVNTAARSGETFERLGGAFDAEALGKVELKGKAEPVALYRIRGRIRPGGES
jgi:adenylate cyclase